MGRARSKRARSFSVVEGSLNVSVVRRGFSWKRRVPGVMKRVASTPCPFPGMGLISHNGFSSSLGVVSRGGVSKLGAMMLMMLNRYRDPRNYIHENYEREKEVGRYDI